MRHHRPFSLAREMGRARVSDMNVRAWLSLAACGAGLLLSGCGSTAGPTSVKPTASALAGNWLIAGPLPTNDPNTATGFRLALTFDVTGNNIVAGGFGSNFCDNAGYRFGSVASGTVAADGSFTMTTSVTYPFATGTIKGMVPQVIGGPWSGSYALSLGTPAPACDANLSGTFVATSFPLVSGIYVGTGSVQTTSGVTMPLTFQVSLQQGGTLTNPVNGATSTIFSNAVLTGSIRVQGSPCFSSGVTSAKPASSVEGNTVSAAFTMDDGSTLSMEGVLTDLTEGHIATSFVLVSGGKCGTIPFAYQLAGLDRQS